MITSEVIYEGQLRCKSKHLKSETVIYTDAPVDNHGKGACFSPTDLMATSLGTCMLTIMGIEAQKMNLDIDGAQLSVLKHMGINPRRIVKIDIKISVPDRNLSDADKEHLTVSGINCPVAKSLHPDLVQNVEINYFLEGQSD